MQVKMVKALLPFFALFIAGWSAFYQESVLAVVLAGGTFAIAMALTFRRPDREFYLIVAGAPLVVATGITNLLAGILIQVILIVMLFADDLVVMERNARISLLVVPAAVIVFALFTRGISRVFMPFIVLVLLSVAGIFIIGLQNRLLKMKYESEVS